MAEGRTASVLGGVMTGRLGGLGSQLGLRVSMSLCQEGPNVGTFAQGQRTCRWNAAVSRLQSASEA